IPASAIAVSFCGAATTASTSPAKAAWIARLAKASEARPLAASVIPNESVAASGCAQASTLSLPPDQSASRIRSITRNSALMPQVLAWRSTTPGSLTTMGWQAACTAGSSAAFSAISGPMPAESPVVIAIFVLLLDICLWTARVGDLNLDGRVFLIDTVIVFQGSAVAQG